MKQILYLGNQLATKGLNKTTLETLSNLLEEVGYSVHTASSKQQPFWRLCDMVGAVLKYRKSDFLLIDTYSTTAFWFALVTSQLARILNLKYIPILHGGNLPARLKKNPKLCRMLFENAYRNVAPSNYLYSCFSAAGFTNTVFIPNTIEIEKYNFKLRAQLQPKLLWVRAFATIYNPKMAVDVLCEVKKKYPLAQLCMVGPDKDGSLEETKNYAKTKGVNVTFTGGLTKEQWMQLSEEYDIFLNTTHFDNTPVSVIEAMALGLPIVSTNVGGLPYLLEHTIDSVLVEDKDVNQMVKAIENWIENPSTASAMADAARKKAESFDWKQVNVLWKALLQ